MKTRLLLLLLTLSLIFTASCNQGDTPTTDTSGTTDPPYNTPSNVIHAETLAEYLTKVSASNLELLNNKGGYPHRFISYEALKDCGELVSFTFTDHGNYSNYQYSFQSEAGTLSVQINQYKEHTSFLYRALNLGYTLDLTSVDKIFYNKEDLVKNHNENIYKDPEYIPYYGINTQNYYPYSNMRCVYRGGVLDQITVIFYSSMTITVSFRNIVDPEKNAFTSALIHKKTLLPTLEELVIYTDKACGSEEDYQLLLENSKDSLPDNFLTADALNVFPRFQFYEFTYDTNAKSPTYTYIYRACIGKRVIPGGLIREELQYQKVTVTHIEDKDQDFEQNYRADTTFYLLKDLNITYPRYSDYRGYPYTVKSGYTYICYVEGMLHQYNSKGALTSVIIYLTDQIKIEIFPYEAYDLDLKPTTATSVFYHVDVLPEEKERYSPIFLLTTRQAIYGLEALRQSILGTPEG